MLSLKRAIRTDEVQSELEVRKQLSDAAISAYSCAIEGIREHALRACPPLIEPFSQDLQALMEGLSGQCEASQLIASKHDLLDTLARFGNQAAQDYVAMTTDIQEMIRLAVSATDSLQKHSNRESEELTQFASAFEAISSVENVAELRRRLRAEVQHMHDCLARIARDNAQMIQRLQSEMRLLKQRLQQSQQSACVDALTQLPNRRALEAHAEARLKEHHRFCVIFFNIERCAVINERYGREVGDVIVKYFGQRLTSAVLPTDMAGRWGGAEFLVITESNLQDAMLRMRQMSDKVCGRYQVNADGRDVRLHVNAASSIAESLPSETLDHLIARMPSPYTR